MNLVDVVNENYKSEKATKFPEFKSGDSVSVSVRITEGGKSRLQVFGISCTLLVLLMAGILLAFQQW